MVATACHGVASAEVCFYLDESVAVIDFFFNFSIFYDRAFRCANFPVQDVFAMPDVVAIAGKDSSSVL